MRWHGVEMSDHEILEAAAREARAIDANVWHRYHVQMALMPETPSRILDYGCGWGLTAARLAERGHSVSAIDLSENEIQLCQLVWGERPGVHFSHSAIDSLPDSSFDVVLSSQVIEHVHNPGNYLSQINRVLAPDGLLVISLPGGVTPRSVRRLLRRNLRRSLVGLSTQMLDHYDKANDHINSWDQIHFVRLLASTGFRVVDYRPSEGVALPGGRGARYWRTRIKGIENLCYTMVFAARRERACCIAADA